jgi:hypothetical protein
MGVDRHEGHLLNLANLVSNGAQRQLLRVLTIATGMGVRPSKGTTVMISEPRGTEDHLKEASLQGPVRWASLFVASVLVRQLAISRR